jgi:hypothetical protein
MGSLPGAAEGKQTERESGMCDGAEALAEGAARLPCDDKVARLGVEVHVSRLRKVPARENGFDGLGEAVGNCRRDVSTGKGSGLLSLAPFCQLLSATLKVLHGGVESQGLPHFAALVSELRVGGAKPVELR